MSAAAPQGPLRSLDEPGAAIAWALAAALAASILVMLPKIAAGQAHPLQITFLRYIAGTLVVAPVYAWCQWRAPMPPPSVPVWLHLLRVAIAGTRITCMIYAVTLMPLANAQAIILTNGVFIVLFAVVLLGERPELRVLTLGLICLIGGLFAAEPGVGADGFLSLGAGLAFVAAIMFGLESVIIKYSADREDAWRVLMIINAAGMVVMALPAYAVWRPVEPWALGVITAMGPAAISTQYCNLAAFRRARASFLVPFRYSAIPIGIAVGFFVFGEWPSLQALFGMALIAAGGVGLAILTARGRRVQTPVRPL